MGGGDGRHGDGGGGGGSHPHQFQYQALLAAVHTQNPNNNTLPFPLPPLNGNGPDAPANNAACQPPAPRGFADWSASNSAFTSLAAQSTPAASTAATTNAFHYGVTPCYAFWTHYMLNKSGYSYYPPQHQEHPHPFCPDSQQAKNTGSALSFGIDSFTSTPVAPNISLAPNGSAHMPPMEGHISTNEPETSEDVPRVVRRKDGMETRNGGEDKCGTVDTLPELKQGHESCATKFNSGEYQVILRKELTKSDVANVGRIVLPKKDAEASLPQLCQRDPMILQMDDMVLPVTWKFKYRFWPNNKSRMYILDSTAEFVKTHGLQAGDALVIYKNPVPGKFIIRGEKAIQHPTNP